LSQIFRQDAFSQEHSCKRYIDVLGVSAAAAYWGTVGYFAGANARARQDVLRASKLFLRDLNYLPMYCLSVAI